MFRLWIHIIVGQSKRDETYDTLLLSGIGYESNLVLFDKTSVTVLDFRLNHVYLSCTTKYTEDESFGYRKEKQDSTG